jgi:hypothetical protein
MTSNLHFSGFAAWGSAPALWQKEVAREVELLVETSRSSTWIESWDARPFDLCPKPLLGRTLGEVLGGIGAGGEDHPGFATGEGHGRMTAPNIESSGLIGADRKEYISPDSCVQNPHIRGSVSSGHQIPCRRPALHASPVKRHTADAGIPGKQIDLPSDAPRRAERELLMRLAGDVPKIHIPRRETAVIPSYSESNHATPPLPRWYDLADHRSWVDILGTRASESLRTGGMGIILGKPSDPLPGKGNLRLAEDLGMHLDGPRAPVDLLRFLSESSAFNRGASPGGWPGYGERHQPVRGENRSSGEVYDGSAPFDRPEPLDPLASRRPLAPLETSMAKTAQEIVDAGSVEARIFPPGPSSLPPIFPRRPADGTPFPLATDLSLLETMRESPDVGEDLGALAAKMKRILDEEARRYGIDV